jgi:hypothetical protein
MTGRRNLGECDELRRELGRETSSLLSFMNATAMMNAHRTLYSLTGTRGVCKLRGRSGKADRKYRFSAQTAIP